MARDDRRIWDKIKKSFMTKKQREIEEENQLDNDVFDINKSQKCEEEGKMY